MEELSRPESTVPTRLKARCRMWELSRYRFLLYYQHVCTHLQITQQVLEADRVRDGGALTARVHSAHEAEGQVQDVGVEQVSLLAILPTCLYPPPDHTAGPGS